MRTPNIILRAPFLLGIVISTLCLAPAWGQADPNAVQPIFVSAGGPYYGTVGEPIEFDASLSYLADGNDIKNYYWDWDLDGIFDSHTSPICTHTWQCAFSGEVRLYVFNDANELDWAKANVRVTGPETELCVILKSTADLHLYDAERRHVGLDYGTNGPETEVPKASFRITDDDGNALPLYEHLNDATVCQCIKLPLYNEGPYKVKLVGADDDGAFELSVGAYQDGVCVADETYKGDIFAGEAITVNASACCKDNCLSMECGSLVYYPCIGVSPEEIDLPVDPATTYEVLLTISETTGLRPLRSVTLTCSNLTGALHSIKGSNVTFDLNGFDIPAGGAQDVLVTIPVPENFINEVSGSISIDCIDEASKTVKVTIHKKGFHAPTCDPDGPYKGTVGEPITFDAGWSNDKDGTIVQYCWDWDWDGQFQCTTSAKIQHTWNDIFNGTVLLRVIDDDGHSSEASVSVTVEKAED